MENVENREWRRRARTLARHGLELTNTPTENVILCNAGLATGLRERQLMESFGENGSVDRYILEPGKSYSIVVYRNVQDAIRARSRVHGFRGLCQNDHPAYVSYSTQAPRANDPEAVSEPEGLHILKDFITDEEEATLLNCIRESVLRTERDLKNRRVKHFGYEFMYGTNNVDLNRPLNDGIPKCCDFLWDRLRECGFDFSTPPDQLTVNQYAPGQGIPLHVDTHSAFLSPLISLSLESTVIMDFKRKSSNNPEHFGAVLPSKSILLMDGPSRYEWLHGINSRTYDIIGGRLHERTQRTSFTFRWVRPNKKCDCSYHDQCDTFKAVNSNMTDKASIIEHKHVHQVYEEIALHFSDTRTKIWPGVRSFVESLFMGSTLIDVGCGNGKNFTIRNDLIIVGLEYSNALANVAAKRALCDDGKLPALNKVIRGNCLNLPFRTECADAAISIAVFHHLVTPERRLIAIAEVVRILRFGGRALITVWAKDQRRNDEKTSYLKQDRKNRKVDASSQSNGASVEPLTDDSGESIGVHLPVHRNRTDFTHQDMLVPWKKKNADGETHDSFMRFYHVFDEDELENLCRKCSNVKIETSFYEQGNWCVIIKKTLES